MDNRYVQQFKKGALEMILLCLIGREETYGYEIISQLNQSAAILGYAKEGTVYPGDGVSSFVPAAGGGADPMPHRPGRGQWGGEKVLFPYP